VNVCTNLFVTAFTMFAGRKYTDKLYVEKYKMSKAEQFMESPLVAWVSLVCIRTCRPFVCIVIISSLYKRSCFYKLGHDI